MDVARSKEEPVPTETPKLNFKVPDAVAYSGLSRSRLYELIKAGEIESIKIGRTRLIPAAAIEAFFARSQRDGGWQE